MKRVLAALALLCACGSQAPPPVTPSNQTTIDDDTREPAAKPAPPAVAVELVAETGLTAGTGMASGTLADTTGAYVIGATVVATSPSLQGTQTAITDEQGRFEIRDLPPGRYTITVYYADLTFEHAVDLADGKVTRLRVTNWDTTQTAGEVILIQSTR